MIEESAEEQNQSNPSLGKYGGDSVKAQGLARWMQVCLQKRRGPKGRARDSRARSPPSWCGRRLKWPWSMEGERRAGQMHYGRSEDRSCKELSRIERKAVFFFSFFGSRSVLVASARTDHILSHLMHP
jgi:hypothetical protein